MLKSPRNIGFILRNLRKMLIWLDVIDESVYVRSYLLGLFKRFIDWVADVLLNGALWTMAVFSFRFLGIMTFSVRITPYLILSLGVLHFMISEAYAGYRKGGR